jgi:hypothetical protein
MILCRIALLGLAICRSSSDGRKLTRPVRWISNIQTDKVETFADATADLCAVFNNAAGKHEQIDPAHQRRIAADPAR